MHPTNVSVDRADLPNVVESLNFSDFQIEKKSFLLQPNVYMT